MKKSKLYIGLSALLIILITLCTIYFINQNSTKSITSFYNNDANKINKIDMIDGSNGNIVTVTDKKMVDDICDYLQSLKLKKIRDEKKDGWTYSLAIYEGSKNSFNITFMGENQCGTKGSKYKLQKSNDVTIESLYKTAQTLKK
jgi:hypothetical protein